MISLAHIAHWRSTQAPWASQAHVEQDLILSRSLVELFANPLVSELVALRGGTALNKLFFERHSRFSEDIDLVQTTPADNGPLIDAIRRTLDPLFGTPPKRRIGEGLTTLIYRYTSNDGMPLKLKVETNTREHQSLFPLEQHSFAVDSPWFVGESKIQTYNLEELLGTKLRALYQRKKGRDLYDLWAVAQEHKIDPKRVITAFQHYASQQGVVIRRNDFSKNLDLKLSDRAFYGDIIPLLRSGVDYKAESAAEWFRGSFLALMSN
jgi:predicted nucleotidyltransferase component of viral defense system